MKIEFEELKVKRLRVVEVINERSIIIKFYKCEIILCK